MGFSTPPGHRNPTYDENTDGEIDTLEDGASFRNAEYDTNTNGLVDQTEGVNVPDWEEDPNSPFTFGTQTNLTANLANPSDTVRVFFEITNAKGISQTIDARVNGATGSDYNTALRDGSFTGSANRFKGATVLGASGRVRGILSFTGHSTGVSMTVLAGGEARFSLNELGQAGITTATSGPISSVTLGLADSISGTIEVYERTVG